MGVRSWNFAKARERPDAAAVQPAPAITGGNRSAEAPLEVTRPTLYDLMGRTGSASKQVSSFLTQTNTHPHEWLVNH